MNRLQYSDYWVGKLEVYTALKVFRIHLYIQNKHRNLAIQRLILGLHASHQSAFLKLSTLVVCLTLNRIFRINASNRIICLVMLKNKHEQL